MRMQPEFLILAAPAAMFFVTWLVYLATMNLIRAQHTLDPFVLGVGMSIFYLGVVMSTALNWLVFTFLLLELPREFTLSARLSRHLKAGGWRGRQAGLIGSRWLDPFDPSGKHI